VDLRNCNLEEILSESNERFVNNFPILTVVWPNISHTFAPIDDKIGRVESKPSADIPELLATFRHVDRDFCIVFQPTGSFVFLENVSI